MNPIDITKNVIWNTKDRVIRSVHRFVDKHQLADVEAFYAEEYHTDRKGGDYRTDAQTVASVLYEEFQPESVIDFGCSIGTHLECFHEHGCTVAGVEGDSRAIDHANIPGDYIDHHDLRDPYTTDGTYDLVLSFEVAEHIPERFSDTLVETLTQAGDIIVFTAAPPGQYGTHHVNCQPRSYWKKKFSLYGFTYKESKTDQIGKQMEVEETVWIPENLFIFER